MNLSNLAMALFVTTSAAGAAASIISDEAAWNDVTQEIEQDESFLSDLERRLQATTAPTNGLSNDPYDAADGGVENKVEVTYEYKVTGSGNCPTSTSGKADAEAAGDDICTALKASLDSNLDCEVDVDDYSCKETDSRARKLSGRNLATTYTIEAVVEVTLTTYCPTGDTAAECDPDSVEALNDQIEAAAIAAVASNADLTFDELVADLVDDLTNWYPNWSGSDSECKNDGKYPNYMKNGILKSTLKSCCESYYGWEEAVCIANSGGSSASLETGDYYIDWDNIKGAGEGYCVRACLKEDSDLNPPLVNCGGLNERWETAYDTAEKCCDVMATYVNKEYCIAKSEGGPDAAFNPTGSGEWYVDGNDCKKDCTTTDSECEALDLEDNWTNTYEDKDDCCATLTWLTDDDGNCPAQADYGTDDDDE